MIIPYIYIRVSSRGQAVAGGGAEDQERVCREYIKHKKGIFTQDESKLKVMRDLGVSAYSGDNLDEGSALNEFYQKVKSGRIGAGYALVCYSVDRISRENVWVATTFIGDLINSGIEIHDVSSGQVLRRDEQMGVILNAIHLIRANNESKMKSERSADSYKRRLNKCLESGEGQYPVLTRQMPRWLYDLNGQYTIKPDMQRVIDFIFNNYIAGVTCGFIARDLNERGWLHGSTKWRGCYVSKLIGDERLIGKHGKHNDFYPAAIDQQRFLLANQMLTNVGKNIRGRTRIAYRDNSRVVNLFSGVLKCGCCGGPTTVNINSNRGEAFVRCRNTEELKSVKCKSIKLKNIEEHILRHLHGLNIYDVIDIKDDKGSYELLNAQMLEYKQHEVELNALMNSRKAEGKIIRLDTIKELENTRDKIDELSDEIEMLGVQADIPNFEVCTDVDMAKILDPSNIYDRCALRNSINNTVTTIEYSRIGEYINIKLNYISDVISHVLIIHNKTGELLTTIKILKVDNKVVYQVGTFNLEVVDNTPVLNCSEKINVQDYAILLNYVDGRQEYKHIANWLREHLNLVLAE